MVELVSKHDNHHWDDEILNDLAEDIASWGNFFIIACEEYEVFATEFFAMLENQRISSYIVTDMNEDSFNEIVCGDDVVLAISQSGKEDNIKSMVKVALGKNTRVYAICDDFKSDLALIASEVLIIDEKISFRENFYNLLFAVGERLLIDVESECMEINDPCLPITSDSPVWQEFVEHFASDFNSHDKFFIIADEEFTDYAYLFCKFLDMNGIPSYISVGENLKEQLNQSDMVLVISRFGNEDYIMDDVKCALVKGAKAYGIHDELDNVLSLFNRYEFISSMGFAFEDVVIENFKAIAKALSLNAGNEIYKLPLILDDLANPPEECFLSPVGGTVSNIEVDVGDRVKKCYVLATIEFGNIKRKIYSDRNGVVKEIMVKSGDSIVMGDILIEFVDELSMCLSEEYPSAADKLREDLRPNIIQSPMQGMVLRLNVAVGDKISKGDVVCHIEAMKMENEVLSDINGVVKKILVELGDIVSKDDVIIIIE